MSDNKLPAGIVLAMEQAVVGNSAPCLNCYFLEQVCPKDWDSEIGFFLESCTNDRDVFFIEVGSEQ